MSDPLATEPTLGGLLDDLVSLGYKPRAEAMKHLLSSCHPARGHRMAVAMSCTTLCRS